MQCLDIDASLLAARTIGFTGADLEQLFNTAASLAVFEYVENATDLKIEFNQNKVLFIVIVKIRDSQNKLLQTTEFVT